ncbi:ribonuclease H-like domain-containing protein [Tanacetum coccineum]
MFLSHYKYASETLEQAHMANCNPSRTPVDTESKLGDDVQHVCLYMHDHREPHFSALKLILRYDADWAGCPNTRRSTLGTCVFLGKNLLSWSSKRQPTLSRSSAEAEYCGVVNAVAESFWLRNLLHLVVAGQVRVLHAPSRYLYANIFTKGLPSALFEEFHTSLSIRCPSAQTARECYSYFEDYYSEDEYAVSIKEDTVYPCLHSPKTTEDETQYAVSIKEDTAYPCLHSPKITEDEAQYAVSRETQYAVFNIWNEYNILEDIKRGPYSKKSPIRRIQLLGYAVSNRLPDPINTKLKNEF